MDEILSNNSLDNIPLDNSIPEEFFKIIRDFISDLKITFPEYIHFINKWWKNIDEFNYIDDETERKLTFLEAEKQSIILLFNFCQKKMPPRFFDILYQNEDMFKEDSQIDTEFLPKIHFKNLWQYDISSKTRETIWKYLQLIMFSIVGTLNNKNAFGDTAKMFETIDQEEFKSKLEETLSQMHGLFDLSNNVFDLDNNLESNSNLPDATKIHTHITDMLDGKLGQLAREIAEETASNLDIDFDDATDMKDILQKLVQNPTKIMGLVKTVGSRLENKIKSGDLSESELVMEATDIMNKMKNMPGMENIQTMLSKLGVNNFGLNGNGDTPATESQLKNKSKIEKTKQRIRAKAETNLINKLKEEEDKIQQSKEPLITEEEILKIFSNEEKIERTPRNSKLIKNKNK
jgi:hypothetical protein